MEEKTGIPARQKPEAMMNVILSDDTKMFLVAYKTAYEAQEIATDQIALVFGKENVDEFTDDLLLKMKEFQEEILKLMSIVIDENLQSLTCTEI